MLGLSRRALISSRSTWQKPILRKAHTEVQRPPGSPKDDDDFRPPWVYTVSRLGSFTIIPGVALYAIFLYDWGDGDHVFVPPRRWLAKVKQSFFTLSPAEEQLLKAPPVEQRTTRLPPAVPPLPTPTSSSS